jgi:hypothetical protein
VLDASPGDSINPANPHSISFASQSVADFAFVADATVATKSALYIGSYKAFRETTTIPTSTITTPTTSETTTKAYIANKVTTTTRTSDAVRAFGQSGWLLVAAFLLRNL